MVYGFFTTPAKQLKKINWEMDFLKAKSPYIIHIYERLLFYVQMEMQALVNKITQHQEEFKNRF